MEWEEGRRTITIEVIQKKVAEHYDLRMADMTSKRRPENIAFPRQIAMYLCRKLTAASLPEIGNAFGGRDHTTVIHAINKIEKKIKTEQDFSVTIESLIQQIKGIN